MSATELLTINDRFFVRFWGCSNTAGAILKTRGPICAKRGGNIVKSLLHTKFKNGEVILLRFQTTTAQSRALLSGEIKIALFDPPVKIRGGVGEMYGSMTVAAPMTKPLVYIC